jgi:nucleotide-binding universal stress UspA family protein
VRVETCVEKGDPRDVICGAAEKAGADMLVMGSRGNGFLQRALLGSVSNHCVQSCKCPVVVVKRPPAGNHQGS